MSILWLYPTDLIYSEESQTWEVGDQEEKE